MARIIFLGCSLLIMTSIATVDAASTTEAAEMRVVSVSGMGEVKVEPDQAALSLAIRLRGKNLPALQRQARQSMADFLQLTRELNIKPVKTSQLHVRPQYHWDDEREKRVQDGFIVQRGISLVLKDLDKLGLLINKSIDVGINDVNSPKLQSSQAETLKQKALAKAAANAQTKAKLLARQLGATLGAVRQIHAIDNQQVRPRTVLQSVSLASARNGGGIDQTYQPGLITFTAHVQATFDLQVE